MLKLEFGFGLDLDRDGMALTREDKEMGLDRVKAIAMREFGGCFVHHGHGNWQDPDTGTIFSEKGAVLSIITSEALDHDRKVSAVAEAIKMNLRQKAVYVTEFSVQSKLF